MASLSDCEAFRICFQIACTMRFSKLLTPHTPCCFNVRCPAGSMFHSAERIPAKHDPVLQDRVRRDTHVQASRESLSPVPGTASSMPEVPQQMPQQPPQQPGCSSQPPAQPQPQQLPKQLSKQPPQQQSGSSQPSSQPQSQPNGSAGLHVRKQVFILHAKFQPPQFQDSIGCFGLKVCLAKDVPTNLVERDWACNGGRLWHDLDMGII